MGTRRTLGRGKHLHYAHCTPQHQDLNQKDWLGLKDYIIGAAATQGFRLSVLTEPVFHDSDGRLRARVAPPTSPIPEEFWEVGVMIDAATGYVLSQGRMIRSLVESAFVYGRDFADRRRNGD
ncbi:DNA/RNA non-specific endonuclease [Paracoccus beibuensis]|uniref:DNA/RNA non-specific endonuclease n=1 Tax=Paracoccus beibuensis TaxID=547602 RepID=UPI002240A637|nr:DNA/RNA non-specific endonuclease [Paracoccus beibuensis]